MNHQRKISLVPAVGSETFCRAIAVRCMLAAAVLICLLALMARFLPPKAGFAVGIAGSLVLYALWCAGLICAAGSLFAREPRPLRSVGLLLFYIVAAVLAALPAFRPATSNSQLQPCAVANYAKLSGEAVSWPSGMRKAQVLPENWTDSAAWRQRWRGWHS